MDVLNNTPLFLALFAVIFAQVVKIPIYFIAEKKLNASLAFSTGGMPSSHSAAVAALTTSVGIEHGLDSPFFAISCVLSIIVMYDATGIRRHAGQHATLLNQLVKDFQRFVDEAKSWQEKEEQEKQRELKELLGHQPIEVFFGAITGILIAIIFYSLI
ncbi:divergent PAP2 family protein [Filobacillus milosensis]|uniref:Divergent PAP2 family protein n=1 Tax=Filobacillus milosensis TaxID=94137 RepID=A0A4Y8ITT2_9BACI|nr:divergent PAP2 family protein [Filobacillus milosensis]TFB24240.1 divergent PAP2 family protein [Filobacillus milosensis]